MTRATFRTSYCLHRCVRMLNFLLQLKHLSGNASIVYMYFPKYCCRNYHDEISIIVTYLVCIATVHGARF